MAEVKAVQSDRAAPAPIGGYLYQASFSALRWLKLKADVTLIFEGDEDLDRLTSNGNAGISEQFKALSRSTNVTDDNIRKTLENFLINYVFLREDNKERRFVFTTTAQLRRQMPGELGIDVLAHWNEPGRRREIIKAVRKILDSARNYSRGREHQERLTAATGWMGEAQDRWDDFINTVEWNFGEPNLKEIRHQITVELGRRFGTQHQPAEILAYRLMHEVLDISSRREINERKRNRKDLDEFLESVEQNLIKWAATPQAVDIQAMFQETLRLEEALEDKTLDFNHKLGEKRPGKLLTAGYEIVPFEQVWRQRELDDLAKWCDRDDLQSVWLLYGEGGVGKTRLLIEWCKRLKLGGPKVGGWHAGFLKDDHGVYAVNLLHGIAPRLLVIDYAEERRELVRKLVRGMAGRDKGPKVRLVLLARHLSGWWEALPEGEDAVEDVILLSPEPRRLSPLVASRTERVEAFQRAIEVFGRELHREPPAELPEVNLEHQDFNRALYLHMAALAALDGESIKTGHDALKRTLEHERRFWRLQIRMLNTDAFVSEVLEGAMNQAVAALTLVGGVASSQQARSLLERIVGEDEGQRDLIARLLWLLRRHYRGPSEGVDLFIDGLQPDLLGEQLIEEALSKDDNLLRKVFEEAVSLKALSRFMAVLFRLVQRRFPGLDRDRIERLEHGLQWLSRMPELEQEEI